MCVSINKSVLGISLNLNAGLVNLFGPNINGPAFLENTGSVIIVISPNFIRKVACPIQVMKSSSLYFSKSDNTFYFVRIISFENDKSTFFLNILNFL